MNFLARIKKGIVARAKGLIGGAMSWAGVDWGGYMGSYGGDSAPRDVGAWLRAFKRVGQLRAPVNRIAEDTAFIPFYLMRRIDGPVGIDGKPPAEMVTKANAQNEFEIRLLELMRKPSPMMTGSRWRWLVRVWLEAGGGYAPQLIEWEQVGRFKVPRWLHPIQPQKIVGIPTRKKPYFRIRNADGRVENYAPGDLVWINYIDPEDCYGMGAAPALAVDDEVNQIAAKDTWNNNFFRQGAHPGAIVGVEGMSAETKKQLQDDWNSKYTGVHNAHKTLFLPHKVDIKPLSAAHKDLDFVTGDQRLGDRIRFNWGMPPELLGDVRNSNRATIQGAEKVHQQGNLAPFVLYMEEIWNDYILPLFPGTEDLFITFANPVKQTEEQRHEELTDGLEHGAVTRDEWRMGHKMDPWGAPHGNQYGQPLNTTWVSLDGPVFTNQPNEEDVTRAFAAFAKALHRGGEGYRSGGQASNGSSGVLR